MDSSLLEEIIAYPQWFWIAFGGIMLAAELLGAAGYLLWSGISAVIVGLLTWAFPLISWEWSWLLFSMLTVIVSMLWWKWSKRFPKKAQQKVNRRYGHLIGTHTIVVEAIVNGSGRVKIADSTWLAKCPVDLAVNTQVEVIGIDSITLDVVPINDKHSH